MSDFESRVAVVTGAGAGIGLAIVRAFVEAGASVVGVEIDGERADALREELANADSRSMVIEGDVCSADTVAELASTVEAKFGGLDILINNVGDFLMLHKPLEMLTDEEVERLYATNLRHVFSVTKAMIPLLRKRAPGSNVVSVSSIEGFRGIPNCAVYAACKAGMTGFTQSLALELGPAGIRVNLIAPETTDTPQVPVSQMIAPEHKEHTDKWIPLGRFGTVEDMADGVLFLASPRAAWITGTTLHIDGGALAAAGWYRDNKGTWTNLPVTTGNGLNF
ncbi:SDR family NAD(P)-dependent oxidoreductase [Pacificimonas sp. ICDLI1SI03]